MSPDRQALAAAIERRTKLADELLRIQAAREPARQRNRDAELALEAAEQALREAAEPRALVDALIGGQSITTTDVVALNNAVSAATEALSLAQRVSRALAERERETQADLDAAAAAVREAATRVLRNSPEVAELVARLADARRTLAAVASIGSSILGIMPPNWDVQPKLDPIEASTRYIAPWRDALTALETDAEAPLPSELGAATPGASSPPPGGSTAPRVAVPPVRSVGIPNGRST